MPDVRRRATITGRVQGVFFRDTCAREARARGVRGWVRNMGDGTVEAVFEGAPDAVAEMMQWCHVGPPGAVVSHVTAVEEMTAGEPPDFRVR